MPNPETGNADDTITSGLEGAWTYTPVKWSHDYFENLFDYEWVQPWRFEYLGDDPGAYIPSPFDPRLIWYIPPFVAQAAMDSGVARKPIEDMDAYRASLAQRLDPTAAFLQKLQGTVQASPKKKIVFAEGEEPSVIRARSAAASG